MVCLTGLFLSGGLTLNVALGSNYQHYAGQWMVQIPASDSREDQTKIAADITKRLRATEGISAAKIVEDAKVEQLLAPWFGSHDVVALLPIPTVIEVTLAKRPPPSLTPAALADQLNSVIPGIQVDDNAQWVEQYLHFTTMVQRVAFGLAMLVVACTGAIVVLSAMTSLKLHQRTVQLLHSFGATDAYIARQFQWNAFLLALRGSCMGALLAGMVYVTLDLASSQLEAPLLPHFAFTPLHFALLVSMPLVIGLLALLATRVTTLTMLRHMH